MKTLALAALLLATQAFAAEDTFTVREFANNTAAQDWVLANGWTWHDGVLSHAPGAGDGVAQQAAMPALTPGRLYRVDLKIAGRTRGEMTVSLGSQYDIWYGPDGTFSGFIWVADPEDLLTFTPTADFDGSVSNIRAVELGDELVDNTGWVLTAGWSQNGSRFTHAAGNVSNLERPVGLVRGHTYRVYFSVATMTNQHPGPQRATVTLGDGIANPFNLNGNYAYDLVASGDGGSLVLSPQDAVEPLGLFDGAISLVSVREITSDVALKAHSVTPGR